METGHSLKSTEICKKKKSSILLINRFWRISPEPFELQKIYLPFLALIFEELSDGKGIFQIGARIS